MTRVATSGVGEFRARVFSKGTEEMSRLGERGVKKKKDAKGKRAADSGNRKEQVRTGADKEVTKARLTQRDAS
jgi:hypothetical protein